VGRWVEREECLGYLQYLTPYRWKNEMAFRPGWEGEKMSESGQPDEVGRKNCCCHCY
jgi:hypothetical protein